MNHPDLDRKHITDAMKVRYGKLSARRDELDNEIEDLRKRREIVDQQMAEILCPFAVGDRLVKGGVGDEVEVSTILPFMSSGYRLFVKKIRKNGLVYVNETELWDDRHWAVKS